MRDLPDYDSPNALGEFLEDNGMAMQKKFGQNFLVNRKSRERLVDALALEKGMSVWEIGPGLGAMTQELLARDVNLVAFEIDRGFSLALQTFFESEKGFTIVEGDVLKSWKKALAERGKPDRLFGNLPYNIAATIIADTISEGVLFDSVVVTIQKEVAVRMTAAPGSKDYSSFSVLCQWAYEVAPVMDLAAGSFWPRPNVASRAVRMTRRPDWPGCSSPDVFKSLLRGMFSSRRKTILNNLRTWLANAGETAAGASGTESGARDRSLEYLEKAGINPSDRPESLSVDDFRRLSDCVVTP